MAHKWLVFIVFLLALPMLTERVNASTYWSNWTNPDTTGNPQYNALNLWFGYKFLMTNITSTYTFNINVKKSASADGTHCRLTKYTNTTSGGDFIANATLVGNDCSFTGVSLTNNTFYVMAVDSATRTYGTQHFPYQALSNTGPSFFNVTARYYSSSSESFATDNTFTIEQINISYADITPTSINLTLDGGLGNISHSYSLTAGTNIIGMINVTGLNVSIAINGTTYNTSATSSSYNTVLPVGYWNITAFYDGNATWSGSSKTLWANISKLMPNFSITFNPSNTVNWGALVLISCINIPTQLGAVSGFYNDTSITDASYYFNTTNVLGGTYNLTCNTTGNANYTTFTTSAQLIVNPKPINATFIVTICFTIESLNNCFNLNTTNITTFTTRSKKYCSNNATLTEDILINNEGMASNTYASIDCPFGCNNATFVCKGKNDYFYDYLWEFLVIIGIFAIIYWFVLR
jgi:hypothetical protein